MNSHLPRALGGKIVTRPYKLLVGLFALAMLLIAWRMVAGLGATTAMNDGYPFGLWIAFDVVTGTALACGGYAMAILIYVFNKGKYHPLIRPAILTSALGYSIAGFSVAIDVGRPWLIWRVPVYGWRWNFNSALLEVALCIMAYVVVLWIELAPAFLEKWRNAPKPRLASIVGKTADRLDRLLPWIVALGVLLPTMHQSSLGTMMLLAGDKLHPLWNTPLLPLEFLVGCILMGYGAVTIESCLGSLLFKRRPETAMLAKLSFAAAVTLWLFVLIRLTDLIVRDQTEAMFAGDLYSTMLWLELCLLLIPGIAYFWPGVRTKIRHLFSGAVLVVLAGAIYRFDTYLVGYNPGNNWSYFPAVPEQLVTLGLVAFEVAAYVLIVKRFPILAGHSRAETA